MNAVTNIDQSAVMERVLVGGDLSKLNEKDRLFYYARVCESVGLNPLTKPFAYIQLNGKLTLYALRDATDQLRKLHGVSVTIKSRDNVEGVYVVTANAKDKTGREDESTGAVSIGGLKGDALANALMKAETKAKRRVTLSICGLGMLDETEIETISNARPVIAPEGDAEEHADAQEVVNAADKMRAALLSKQDANIYRAYQELQDNQDVYMTAWKKLDAAQRREFKAACTRFEFTMNSTDSGMTAEEAEWARASS